MRWISLSPELALPHLLELEEIRPPVRDLFAELLVKLNDGDQAAAMSLAEQAYVYAKAKSDHYGGALAQLLKAEIFRAWLHWEDSLDAIKTALHWLEIRVSPGARYNEAVAVYLEGVVHWTLRAEEKVLETFAYSQHALAETQQYWVFQQNTSRAEDCRNLGRWMSSILALPRESLGYGGVVLPVYELVSRTMIRTGAFLAEPVLSEAPDELLETKLAPGYVPIYPEPVPFAFLRPRAVYIAIRIPKDGAMVEAAREGDLLITEMLSPGPITGEPILTSDRPFLRRDDGRIEFPPSVSQAPGGPELFGQRLVGIPRILVRGREKA